VSAAPVLRDMQLHVTGFSDAARAVGAACYGRRGLFAYQAFDWVNATLFAGRLPTPLILWELTAHGGCLGLTHASTAAPPIIRLHPSMLGGTEKDNPWKVPPAWLGPAYALDVLIHECIHVSVAYLLGGATGPTSHNNPQWVAEVNRIGPLLGLAVRAGRSVTKRVPCESGETGPAGKPRTRTVRVTEAGATVPFRDVAAFPYGVRRRLGLADASYRRAPCPFSHALSGGAL
jgi:hypothetical protein